MASPSASVNLELSILIAPPPCVLTSSAATADSDFFALRIPTGDVCLDFTETVVVVARLLVN